jgi:uncharacterized circularly permuted ATP-grasp superfamily protein
MELAGSQSANAAAAASAPIVNAPAEYWDSLLRADVEMTPGFNQGLATRMRAAKLTFGDRIHCPFLRPFFISESDEARLREVTEVIAALGERVIVAALADRSLLAQFGLSEQEERLVRIEPGYSFASTASRLDSFLLPDSLQFAEYNAESPAGPGYTETLGELFRELEVMRRFEERYDVRSHASMALLLRALLTSYRDWGGSEPAPQIAIVDWREVPTWNEFEIIQARFEKLGANTLVCDPRDLEFDGKRLTAKGKKIDFVYRRVLINDIIARPEECAALLNAYEARAVCVANTLRCKIPHKKAFFAVLTDERNAALFTEAERDVIRRHIPWTRVVADTRTTREGESIELLDFIRKGRENFVLKPNDEYGGAGVTLGWENDAASWDAAIQKAVIAAPGTWIAQEKIRIRREIFPYYEAATGVKFQDMLVDSAPYLFRGKLSGYLTRLSATGLANVTSGGGQVPVFVVRARTE